MKPDTDGVQLKMMTAADVALLVLIRNICRLLPLIMSARDLWKAVLVGLLLRLKIFLVEVDKLRRSVERAPSGDSGRRLST